MTLTAAQLEARRRGVGSSDIAVIVGLSRFSRTVTDLYCEKLGWTDAAEESEAQGLGHALERWVRDRYAALRNCRVLDASKALPSIDGTCIHPELPWAMATPDGAVVDEHGTVLRLVECKVSGAEHSRLWTEDADGIPQDYLCQVQWQCFVCNVPCVDVAALIGGTRFRVYRIQRDDEFIDLLRQAAERFMEALQRQVPPLHTTEDVAVYLDARYPRPKLDGKMIWATEETDRWARKLERVHALQSKLAVMEAQIVNQLKLSIGENIGVEGTWYKARWSLATGRIPWKEVAETLGATDDFAEQFRPAGTREFRFYPSKKKGDAP